MFADMATGTARGGFRRVGLCLVAVTMLAACSGEDTTAPTSMSTKTDERSTDADRSIIPPASGVGDFALVHGRLIDGIGGPPLEDASLIVRNGQIVDVGSADSVELSSDLEVVDVQGATILPGLVNAHVHEVFDAKTLLEFAAGGVTTVCDLQYNEPGVSVDEIFSARNALDVPGAARLAAAGRFVNVPGGYPTAFFDTEIIEVATEQEAVQAVDELADAGANVIKTTFESGTVFGQTGWPVLSPDVADAIVTTAHTRGLPVIAHVLSWVDVDAALAAGVDGLAHLPTGDLSDDMISRVVESGIFIIPTMELYSTFLGEVGMTGMVEHLARLNAAGVPIALGSDYDGIPNEANVFDVGYPMTEITLMRDAGMSPMEIIVAGSRNAAAACNVSSVTGTIEVGKDADLMVVEGDPLADLDVLMTPAFVLVRGVPVPP